MAAAVLQTVANEQQASAATIAVTITNVTAASTLLVHVQWSNPATTDASVADDTNGSYGASLDAKLSDTTNGVGDALWRIENSSAGTIVITATFTPATDFRIIRVLEIGGVKPSAALDGHNANQQSAPGTGTDAIVSGNAINANQPALILGVCSDNDDINLTAPAVGTGFASEATGGTFLGAFTAYVRYESKRITTSGGAVAATFTADLTSGGSIFHSLVAILDEDVQSATPSASAPTSPTMFFGSL